MTVASQPLREARAHQEEGASADYLLLAREQICRTLLATGAFTADDLEPLGIPEQYRRSVHGSATGYFSGEEPFMEEAGRRKSERPERKGAKNTIFRITAKGRRGLPGLLAGMAGPVEDARKRLYGEELIVGHRAGGRGEPRMDRNGAADATPSSVSGEQSAPTGAPQPQGSDRATNPPVPSASVDSGDGSGVPSHAPEPTRLPGFDDAPRSAYNPYSEAA